jgi:hypothetical protein
MAAPAPAPAPAPRGGRASEFDGRDHRATLYFALRRALVGAQSACRGSAVELATLQHFERSARLLRPHGRHSTVERMHYFGRIAASRGRLDRHEINRRPIRVRRLQHDVWRRSERAAALGSGRAIGRRPNRGRSRSREQAKYEVRVNWYTDGVDIGVAQ